LSEPDAVWTPGMDLTLDSIFEWAVVRIRAIVVIADVNEDLQRGSLWVSTFQRQMARSKWRGCSDGRAKCGPSEPTESGCSFGTFDSGMDWTRVRNNPDDERQQGD
jgi:hypothetical protein